MFDDPQDTRRKRLVSGMLAAGLQAGLALLLIYGLAAPVLHLAVAPVLTSLDLRSPLPPSPPPPPRLQRAATARPAAALPARLAQAAPVIAPRAILAKPPAIPVAPIIGPQTAANIGAANAGSGSGAGGSGNGSGAGGDGSDGGGDGPELVSGRIKTSDTPATLREMRFSGTTRALVAIDAAGAVSDCRIQSSSGNAILDALTCRLIQERFRFHPARDAAGRAIAGRIIYEHEWDVGGGFDNDPPQ